MTNKLVNYNNSASSGLQDFASTSFLLYNFELNLSNFFPRYALKAATRHPEGWRFRSLSEKESRALAEAINLLNAPRHPVSAIGCKS